MKNSLLLFGCDFLPEYQASEINFWRGIVGRFTDEFSKVIIVSVNNRKIHKEILDNNILLLNIQPDYFGQKKDQQKNEETGREFNKLPNAVFYKSLCFLKNQPLFDELIEQYNVSNFHFLRIFGLFNNHLKRKHPNLFYTMTVPTHIDRGFPFHNFYHSIKLEGMAPMDKLVATSVATKNRLIKLGLSEEKISVIPWTSPYTNFLPEQNLSSNEYRCALGIPENAKLVLWSGPLQDTSKEDFYKSIEIAKLVTQQKENIYFVFAFKPGRKDSYCKDITTGDNSKVIILETSKDEFEKLKKASTVALSLISNKNRTVAPPLTWIELMQDGVPIITNQIDGVSEIITSGKDGFVIDSDEDAIKLLTSLDDFDWPTLRENCIEKIKTKYSIDEIANAYINLWKLGYSEKSTLINQ